MSVSIKYINLISFGQFENTEMYFSDGFNLIYGGNESGKSTITSFIEGILYGFDEGAKVRRFNDKHSHYKPIGSYKYTGFAVFNKDGRNYRISRNFADGNYEIYDLDQGKVVESKTSNLNYPGEFLLGIDYDIYKELISTYQAQDTNQKAKDKIIEHLSNGRDYHFSANEAIAILEKKEKEIGSDRAFSKPYLKTKNEIENLKDKINELAAIRSTYQNDFVKLDKNRNQLLKKKNNLAELKSKRKAYRENVAYKNLEDEIKYQNELNYINKKLESIKVDQSIDEEINTTASKQNLTIALLIAAVILLISLLTEFYYLIALAIIIPAIYYFYTNKDNENSTLYDTKKYNNKEYQSYHDLVKEKEKIEEILRVLGQQDQTIDRENMLAIKNTDIASIEEKISRLENEIEDMSSDNLALEKKLAAAEDKLSYQIELVDKLKEKEANLSYMEEELAAINLAKTTLNEIVGGLDMTSSGIDQNVSDMARTISKGKYQSIKFDENLSPRIETAEGEFIDIDKLSTGFYDQLNFALRLSIGESANESFLIFDDAFINYDLDRMRLALFYLLDLADFRQIIYMTCHKREMEVLLSESIDINVINLEEI